METLNNDFIREIYYKSLILIHIPIKYAQINFTLKIMSKNGDENGSGYGYGNGSGDRDGSGGGSGNGNT